MLQSQLEKFFENLKFEIVLKIENQSNYSVLINACLIQPLLIDKLHTNSSAKCLTTQSTQLTVAILDESGTFHGDHIGWQIGNFFVLGNEFSKEENAIPQL